MALCVAAINVAFGEFVQRKMWHEPFDFTSAFAASVQWCVCVCVRSFLFCFGQVLPRKYNTSEYYAGCCL